jgi:hypothetical protein
MWPTAVWFVDSCHRWWSWLTRNSWVETSKQLRTQATRAGISYHPWDRYLRTKVAIECWGCTLFVRTQLGNHIMTLQEKNVLAEWDIVNVEFATELLQKFRSKSKAQQGSGGPADPLCIQDQMKSINKLCMERRSVVLWSCGDVQGLMWVCLKMGDP